MSTLAIHPGPVGDVLLAVPALRALKAEGPAERLLLAAQPGVGSLLAALGTVDGALSFDGLALQTLFVEADDAPPAVDAVRRASRIVCWFGSRDPVFARRLRALAPEAVVASPTGDGAILVWRHLLATIQAAPGGSLPPCDPSPAARRAGRQALIRAGWRANTRLVIAHPGAGSRDKRWPAEGFVQVLAPLCDREDVTVVLHEGPADVDAVAAVDSRLAGRARVLRGLLLVELAGALVQAAAYLGNDSGVSHLAAAVGLPSVILFEERRVAWRPWSASADVVLLDVASVVKADVVAVAGRLAPLLA
ncbi:MAG: glycosyltransferase family 9 protein [Candidatus Rokuibacteriota bacterium]